MRCAVSGRVQCSAVLCRWSVGRHSTRVPAACQRGKGVLSPASRRLGCATARAWPAPHEPGHVSGEAPDADVEHMLFA